MIYKDMNCHKEDGGNGKDFVQKQDNRILIQDHTKQAGSKCHDHKSQQKIFFSSQFLAEDDGMDDAEQQENTGC